MPFQPVADAWGVVVKYHVGSIIFENVFGYDGSLALNQARANAIGTVLSTAYGELLGAQKTTVVYDSVVVTDLTTETGAQFTASTFGTGVGTDTAELLPYQTAALISWATDTRGRSFRGRTYLTGFCEDHSSGRDLSANLIEACQDFVEAIVADGGFRVISRFHPNPSPPPNSIRRTTGIATPITSGTVHPLWRTQRRRATR